MIKALKLSSIFLLTLFLLGTLTMPTASAQNPKQMKKHRKRMKKKQKKDKKPKSYKPRRKDSDGDGVADYADHCEDTPRGQPVTPFGCPIDTDFDGLVDTLDACVDVPGPIDNEGCPWPDTDGDGITDNNDKCPQEKGPRENIGCPWADRDGDGIVDKDDKCPDLAGVKEYEGCPDTDGDGLPDHKDKCPEVKGLPEDFGCPPLKEEEQEAIREAFKNLHFQTGKAIIKRSSYASLDKLAVVMIANGQTKLTLHGHTDDIGDFNDNMQLSKDRAQAVKEYLHKKGIALDRMTAEGFGETKPVAPNASAKGRQKNRRVEMILVY